MTAYAKRIPEEFAGACGVIAKPYAERGVKEAIAYVVAGQDRDALEAQPMTLVPFGRIGREDSSYLP